MLLFREEGAKVKKAEVLSEAKESGFKKGNLSVTINSSAS